jgi:hypothetical protein
MRFKIDGRKLSLIGWVGGSKSWLKILPCAVQKDEFAKLAHPQISNIKASITQAKISTYLRSRWLH